MSIDVTPMPSRALRLPAGVDATTTEGSADLASSGRDRGRRAPVARFASVAEGGSVAAVTVNQRCTEQEVPQVYAEQYLSEPPEDCVTPAEFAQKWKISRATAYRWIDQGRVSDVFRVGEAGYMRIGKNAQVKGRISRSHEEVADAS